MVEKKLKDVVLEFEPTGVNLTQGNSLKLLRAWAVKLMKESVIVLIVYGVWACLFNYAYMRAGFSGLAISGIIAILYKLDNLKVKK